VPEQLAIMGFNDQEIASSTIPTITSVRTPRREIGQIVAQMLVDHLQGCPPAERQVDLGFKIIERATASRCQIDFRLKKSIKPGWRGVRLSAIRDQELAWSPSARRGRLKK
jgi:hypothetical protein